MQTETPDRILRINTVLARTGLSRPTNYRSTENGRSRGPSRSARAALDGASLRSMPGCAVQCSAVLQIEGSGSASAQHRVLTSGVG